MPSAPSRFEVEQLHRLVTQASVETARLDARIDDAQEADGLWPALRNWSEAADALEEALVLARPALLEDGATADQLGHIRERLIFVRRKTRQFSLDAHLGLCVQAWNAVGLELAQLSGRRGDALVRLLQQRKSAIDRATAMLSHARQHGGLLQDEHLELEELHRHRELAWEKYERLRNSYQAAQRDFEAAQRQTRTLPGAAQHVVVRLPAPPKPIAVKPLHRVVGRNQGRDGVAARLEKTLSQLATAEHRTLTDPQAGNLRAHLARMDSILARLQGKVGNEMADGARAVGTILMQMSSLTARAGTAPHVAAFRKLIEERKGQLQRIAQAQLAGELSKPSARGLHALPGTRPDGALGAASRHGATVALRSGLGALAGGRDALVKALEPPPVVPGLQQAPAGTPLRELVRGAELRQSKSAVRKGPAPAQVTAAALQDRFREHPKGKTFAAHLAPGGPLRALCETAQRGHGLPIGQAAQHYLTSRGSSHLWNAVATFNTLVREGHTPRFSFGSWLKKNVSDHVSHAIDAVSRTGGQATQSLASVAGNVRDGISSMSNRAAGALRGVARGTGQAVKQTARGLGRALNQGAQATWGEIKLGAHALARVGRGGLQSVHAGASWLQHKAGVALDRAGQEARGGARWLGEGVHSGLEWARKTGVVGAVGTGLRKGLSSVRSAAEHSPLGVAVKKGYGFVKSGGLTRMWHGTQHAVAKAWGGLKNAYGATSKFLQSPAGQLLVTGLSLAASFIPGGIIVKAVIGAGIGVMQAISEGKDWKTVLASAAGGALTGAIPFLKIGPLAKLGVGALQGGITALASGGSLKDAVKGAGGGALDAFEPGAFHALKRLKSFKAAEKLLKTRKLSGAGGPVRALEKALSNPRAREVIGALEKAGSKGVKGGIWVSGKAARAQHVLDKVVVAGERVHGALEQMHEVAPSLAEALGDNAAGHLVNRAGEWAGAGDEKLQKALVYGHAASGALSKSRRYLDAGLGSAGVKDPAKAYEKMTARSDLRAGKKGALEHLAQLKLEEHRHKHPELRLAEATGMRTRRPHDEEHPLARSRRQPEQSGLEKALARGRQLVKKGQRVAQGAHDKLGNVHDVMEKGLAGAEKVQSGLEKATALARQGAELFGEDSELGEYLSQVADRADRIHDHLESGIEVAQKINQKVGVAHDALEKIPGIQEKGDEETAVHLEGAGRRKSPHAAPGPSEPPANAPERAETGEQKAARLRRAWERIGSVSSQVQKFELESGKAQLRIQELLRKGRANEASLELMGLGSRCEQIDRAIREAKTFVKGHEQYEKEIAFYEDWHAKTRARLHAAIADAKGLGGQVAISGFGIQESTHPDIFENTRAIYAVRTKVQSFAEALHDPEAAGQVKRVLAEARQAKADLQALKAKYRQDKAAHEFLTGGGTQDKLIDDVLRKLEGPAKTGLPKPAPAQPGFGKQVENGLAAIGKFRRKAVQAGKRVDSGLEQVERGLGKGIRIGKKVDSGLEKLAGLAEQVSGMLGEDSALGHLAHQVGEGAGSGHQKLHDALGAAQKGKTFLHKGHQIFHQGLEAAQGHHAAKLEKEHGKPGAHGLGGLERIVQEGTHPGEDAAGHLVHDVSDVVHGGWELVKGLFGGGKSAAHAQQGAAEAVQNALQWVTAFGREVTAAIKDIEALLPGGRTKEAERRVGAVSVLSEQTRAEIAAAAQSVAGDPKLAAQLATARKHYGELRAHFFAFAKGLHGLAGPPEGGNGKDRPAQPGIDQLLEQILGGGSGRIHVDRGGAQAEIGVIDLQDLDPAALDTWIGSGQGAELFSEVFGAFLPAEGAIVVHHAGHGHGGGHRAGGEGEPSRARGRRRGRSGDGFFAKLFDRLEGFADRIGGWAKKGSSLLGKGMHCAEMGMHGLSRIEGAAEKVQGYAGKAERFLDRMGLRRLAGYAGKVGGAAGRVDEEAKLVHGGLKTADEWMGKGKKATGEVEHGAEVAAGVFDEASHGRFGKLVNLFKASKGGSGIDGKLSPDRVALGSVFDEPRRLDLSTLSRMGSYLGGDFSGVRIHTGPGADQVTRRFNAEAVTVRDHIFFAPGRFNPGSVEGQKLIAHELTHVLQKGRANLDVRTAEGEALHSEHGYGHGPSMQTLNLRRPEPGFRIAADGEGMGIASGIHAAKRTRSRGHEAGGKDAFPDGEEFLEQISGRVYELLMEELEQAFESR